MFVVFFSFFWRCVMPGSKLFGCLMKSVVTVLLFMFVLALTFSPVLASVAKPSEIVKLYVNDVLSEVSHEPGKIISTGNNFTIDCYIACSPSLGSRLRKTLPIFDRQYLRFRRSAGGHYTTLLTVYS